MAENDEPRKILAVAVSQPGVSTRLIEGVIKNDQQREVRPFVKGLIDGLGHFDFKGGTDFDLDFLETTPPSLNRAVLDQLKSAAEQKKSYDVIFPIASTTLQAALSATATLQPEKPDERTPIVFPNISDPVDEGAVNSLDAPGKNATGVSLLRRQLAPECLKRFKSRVPTLRTVHVLHQAHYLPALLAKIEVQKTADALGIDLVPHIVSNEADIKAIVSALTQKGASGKPDVGLLLIPDDLVASQVSVIAEEARKNDIPTFSYVIEHVDPDHPDRGIHAAYGVSQATAGMAAAGYVAKIFKGKKPKELPVRQWEAFEARP